MTAAVAEPDTETPTGVTGGLTKRLRNFADASYAMFHLGVAHAVHLVHDSQHPDLAELQNRGVTVTGKGYDRWEAAVDLVAEEYAHDEGMDFDSARAKIHDAWRKGHDAKTLWQAVVDGGVTLYQARTIENHAERLACRVAVIREVVDADGTVTDLTAEEGDRLFDGETYLHVLDEYLTTAVEVAKQGYTGRKLATRCSTTVRRLTPGYEPVVIEKRTDTHGVLVTPCEDGVNAHVGFVMPLGDALRLQAFANAAADATVEAGKRAGVVDPRSHGERAPDAAADLVRDGLTRHTPASSDSTTLAVDGFPALKGRTHKPATSVQVHVRVDARTLLGLNDEEATVDGLGAVPAHVARQLATSAGAQWRKIVTAPGTRDVIDIGANAYYINDALRRFVTARDEYCRAPGCHVPAVNCDLDHVIRFPDGPTTADNLRAYCRGHHRFKTQYVWESTRAQRARQAARKPEPPDDPPPF